MMPTAVRHNGTELHVLEFCEALLHGLTTGAAAEKGLDKELGMDQVRDQGREPRGLCGLADSMFQASLGKGDGQWLLAMPLATSSSTS